MRESRAPALIGSIALHVLVLGAGLIALPFAAKPLLMPPSVPITIVSKAPPEALTAAVQAPEPTPETTPEPAPVPTPAPPPPPKPAPPAPTPKPAPPQPAPKPAPAKPLDLSKLAESLPEAKPTPAKAKPAAKPVDLAALAATLPKSNGAKGPPKPATAPVVNPGPPRPLTGDELGALTAKLMRLWNPNCGVEGGDKVIVKVEIKLTPEGRLAEPPVLRDRALVDAKGAVAQAAAQRALLAVNRGEPYSELPRDRYAAWKDIIATFDAREACAGH